MNEPLQNLLPQERLAEFISIGKEKSIRSGEYFIKEGETPSKIAFVFNGLFRYVYFNGKGDEFTKALIPEHSFISSYSAMVLGNPSFFSIEALENSRLLEISWSDFILLQERDIFWVKFLLKFIEKGYIAKEKRERELLILDAEARFKNFLAEFPGMTQRIKLGIIASYLGIQPETLSRIRKRFIS
jgi:CRP-like cAMP-binding protein